MDHLRHTRTAALAVLLACATLTAGCSTAPQPAASTTTSNPAPTTPTPATQTTQAPQTFPAQALPAPPGVPSSGHGGRGGSGNGSRPAAAGLPADWPADLPVPQGTIAGSTGSAGRWSVQIVAAGSAAQVHQSTLALYTAAGFTAVTDSVLNKGNRQITLVVENRDHSNTQTNLVIGVTTT